MLDLKALSDAIKAHGRVARIVIAETRGSTPRETGTAMLVWKGGRSGTIGGGRLELEAESRALGMLATADDTALTRQSLGPALQQCCGGALTLLTEVFDAARYRMLCDGRAFRGICARPVEPRAGALPDSTRRMIEKRQVGKGPFATTLSDGWLIEPVWRVRQPVYIYGAGHVGRALALVLAELPRFEVFLCDLRQSQFGGLPDTIHQCWQDPATDLLRAAPSDTIHLIMTPDHQHDLELCHHLLQRSFGFAGLIGSATKWARFRKRLRALGHSADKISGITCPIGDPSLGKHPQAIAVGVVAALLKGTRQDRPQETGA